MSSQRDHLLGSLVEWNNRRVDSYLATLPNPQPVDAIAWHRHLTARYQAIRHEWESFADAGGRLPRIDDVLGEPVDVGGTWRAGILCADKCPTELALRAFPATLAAVTAIPGLQAALLSYLEPHTELLEHRGPNAGVLRYHLGIDCPAGAKLRVADHEYPYRDGAGILFSDRALHAAWNRSDRPRVTLFCEIEADLSGSVGVANRLVQALLRRDPRRWMMVAAANSWHRNLNRTVTFSAPPAERPSLSSPNGKSPTRYWGPPW